MVTLNLVPDPEGRFVDPAAHTPLHGRGAWTRAGIEFSWRYERGKPKIGAHAAKSLDHWAVAAGCWGYQQVLIEEGFLRDLAPEERGLFGALTEAAVKAFQAANSDPAGGRPLSVDGTIGQSDARALLTPIIDAAEVQNGIPDRLLRGETNQESALDCGAVGYFIYYGDPLTYRGVDRGVSQINSASNPQVSWLNAFNPYYAIPWSAHRLRGYYDQFRAANPTQTKAVLWDAALCAHNNPSAATKWARIGAPPTDDAAAYVAAAKNARY